MPVSRLSHKALAQQVMIAKDAQGAIKTILNKLKDQSSMQIARAFGNCRKKILRQNEHLNKHGYGQLVSLSIDPQVPDCDKQKLKDLLLKPIHLIHWAQHHRSWLSSPNANQRFKEIRIVNDPFYDFVCPDHIVFEAARERKKDNVKHNKHQKRERESYHFTTQEVDDMLNQAHSFILQAEKCIKRVQYTKMLDALALVSGRRKWELSSTLKIKSVVNENYQAMITGICKVLDFSEEWHIIPLLIPFDDFVGGIVKLRAFASMKMGDYDGSRLFKSRHMTHTHFRNVYTDAAFRKRFSQNHFLIGDKSCGPTYWKSQALCTTMKNSAEIYDAMCIDQDHEPIDHHGDDESVEPEDLPDSTD